MIGAIHDIVPRAPVPVIVTGEAKHARAFDIERHVEVIGQLIEKMTRIRAFVATLPVVSAAHVSPDTNALVGPALPLPIGIQPDRDRRRLDREQGRGKATREQQTRDL